MMFKPSFFEVLVVVILFIVVIRAIRSRQQTRNRWLHDGRPQRPCENCGTLHPAQARFCRRCGNELPR